MVAPRTGTAALMQEESDSSKARCAHVQFKHPPLAISGAYLQTCEAWSSNLADVSPPLPLLVSMNLLGKVAKEFSEYVAGEDQRGARGTCNDHEALGKSPCSIGRELQVYARRMLQWKRCCSA